MKVTPSRARGPYILISALVLVTSCNRSDPEMRATSEPLLPQPDVFVSHQTTFRSQQTPEWFTYQEGKLYPTPLRVESESIGHDYLVSSGPWWYDPNHSAPGLGFLHVLAFAYHSSWQLVDYPVPRGQAIEISPGNVVQMWRPAGPAEARFGNGMAAIGRGAISGRAAARPLDLRNALVTFRARKKALTLPPDAEIYFWFQAQDNSVSNGEKRFVNYINVAIPFGHRLKSGEWEEIVIPLNEAEQDWACLGSNPYRLDTYGCSVSVSSALSRFDVNMGFVMLVGQSIRWVPIVGEIHFADIRVSARTGPQLAKP